MIPNHKSSEVFRRIFLSIKCAYIKGYRCETDRICCYYCEYLDECIPKWESKSVFHCKKYRIERWCSGVLRAYREEKRNETKP